ncbi:hypothetical protein YPPY58_1454, partial [Yersinia pestis PY-58]
MSRDF